MSTTSTPPAPTDKLTKKALTADHPTWRPGCGDFAVLAIFYRVLEKLQIPHEKIITIAGIGCSSRFPYFMNTHGVHYIHGRALPFATAVSLARPDCHVFVFGGDGDGFSIGGNHLDHTARKNFNLTYVVMDNFVYGMTKNQTSPTSPIGYASKTDPWGVIDEPINPMRRLLSAGATFVARTHAGQYQHMLQMMDLAARHEGFAVVEVLSECTHFYKGSMDEAMPRRGGKFDLVPEDHDPKDFPAAIRLAEEPWPGYFGVFYQVRKSTKTEREQRLIDEARAKWNGADDRQILEGTLARFQ